MLAKRQEIGRVTGILSQSGTNVPQLRYKWLGVEPNCLAENVTPRTYYFTINLMENIRIGEISH